MVGINPVACGMNLHSGHRCFKSASNPGSTRPGAHQAERSIAPNPEEMKLERRALFRRQRDWCEETVGVRSWKDFSVGARQGKMVNVCLTPYYSLLKAVPLHFFLSDAAGVFLLRNDISVAPGHRARRG